MSVEELEVVHVEGRAPTLLFKSAPEPAPPRRVRPTEPRLNVLDRIVAIDSEKNCEVTSEPSGATWTFEARGLDANRCRLVLSLARNGTALDALSYQVMALRGEVSAPVSFGLADIRTGLQGAQTLLDRGAGSFDITIPLKAAAKTIDLRDVTALVISPRQGGVSIRFNELTLAVWPPKAMPHRRMGFWVWDYQSATAHAATLLEACRSVQCDRLVVQTPALGESKEIWHSYAALLQAAQERGIEAFALDGYPEAIFDPQPLIAKVEQLRTVMRGLMPSGLQLDVEPYLLEGFFDDSTGVTKYLDLHAQVKRALGGQTRLSVVMPFWLTSQFAGNRAVAFATMDLADEVALMSYRTDPEELRELVDDSLRYADLIGLPVWLGAETRALPLEEHVRLQTVTRRELATAYLDRADRRLVFAQPPEGYDQNWFRVVQRTTVRPERLTFSRQSRAQVQRMLRTLDHAVTNPSFTGVLIHDYAGFFALPEQGTP